MEIFRLEPDISLIDIAPPIPGFQGILGTYVIQAGKIALIDVGPSSSLENLFACLAELRINPADVSYILCSHIHLDHSGGVGSAIKRMPNAACIAHEKGKYHLANPAKLWQASLQTLGKLAQDYGEPQPVDENRLIAAHEGMLIDLGGLQLEVILTPGHASHHMSFLDRKKGRLFAGEAAGVSFPARGGSRPATPDPFDLRQAFTSLDKLIAAGPTQIFYAHFGSAPEAVERLKQFKKQLLLWGKIIVGHLDDQAEWPEILEEIKARDNALADLLKLPKDNLQREFDFIKNNILGYRKYLKKEGAGVLEELFGDQLTVESDEG